MALSDLQWNYRSLTFGAGTEFHVNHAEGFEGFDVRTSDSDLPRGDGAIRGEDYVAPRVIDFELALIEYAGAATSYEEAYARVRQAFAPSRGTDHELRFKRPGMPDRLIRCRPIQVKRSEDYRRFNILGFPPVVLRAVDPRIYSTEVHQAIVPVHSASSGGMDLGADLPFNFSGATQLETVVVNAGEAPAYPLLRFYSPRPRAYPVYYPSDDLFPSEDLFPAEPAYPGASFSSADSAGVVEGVRLTNTTTGDVLSIDSQIVDDQILTANMTAAVTGAGQSIISVDGASRYSAWQLPRTEFALAPGPNTLRFEVTGSSTSALCSVAWRDTWLS